MFLTFYHGKSPFFTTFWWICFIFPTTKQANLSCKISKSEDVCWVAASRQSITSLVGEIVCLRDLKNQLEVEWKNPYKWPNKYCVTGVILPYLQGLFHSSNWFSGAQPCRDAKKGLGFANQWELGRGGEQQKTLLKHFRLLVFVAALKGPEIPDSEGNKNPDCKF